MHGRAAALASTSAAEVLPPWQRLVGLIRRGDPAPLRVTIVAAHPDDEILGAGALLHRISRAAGRVDVIHVTNGAPADGMDARASGFAGVAEYARARRVELMRALEQARIKPARRLSLGFDDQAAVRHLLEITRRLATYLAEASVDVLLTHPFEGGHPDHDATAFAVHSAVALGGHTRPRPLLVEFTSYHNGAGGIRVGVFLPDTGEAPETLVLSRQERKLKRRARDAFTSQAAAIAPFPIDVERFRRAPAYAFDRRPHPGRLFYEHFNWGVDGDGWCRLAADAMRHLRPGV